MSLETALNNYDKEITKLRSNVETMKSTLKRYRDEKK